MGRKSSAVRMDTSSLDEFSSGFPPVIRIGPREVVYEIRLDSDDVRRAIVDDSRKDTVEGLLWRDIESDNTLRSFRVRGWRIPG